MAVDLQELEHQLLSLPTEDRHHLAVSLWESLEEGGYVAGEFSPEQLAEFERRSEAYKTGKVQGTAWEDIQKELQSLP